MQQVKVWVVDPLTKVFPTNRRDRSAPKTLVIESARNETESGQVALRSTGVVTVHPVVSPLVHTDGDARIDTVRVNPVGYVTVEHGTPGTPKHRRARRAPGLFPDVLTTDEDLRLEPNQTRALWLTVTVPATAKPGPYRGEVTITSVRDSTSIPVHLTVYEAVVPAERSFSLGQWLSADGALARQVPGAVYPSETFFRALRAVARNMHAHRQNVLRFPFGPDASGPIMAMPMGIDGLGFDFSGFDRIVDLFTREGAASLIAGQPVAQPVAESEAPGLQVQGLLNAGGCLAAVNLRAGSPECDNFIRHYLSALHRHLTYRGLIDRYVQHVCDEPDDASAGDYQDLARQVRALLPGVRVVETVRSIKVRDEVDIWVPRLDHLLDHQRWFRDRQRGGEEVWFYTSADLEGRYPNRSLDRSLLDARVLHWMNFAFGATGYLHRGYNAWGMEDPTKETSVNGAPAGDGWIVYPGGDGVLDSIRHETLRDGIEDYELLSLLKARHPRQAIDLVKSVVKSGTNYTASVNTFRKARQRLLELASA